MSDDDLRRLQRASAIDRCRSAVSRARSAREEGLIRSAIDAMRTAEAEVGIAAGSDELPSLAREVDSAWDELTRAICRRVGEES